MGLKINRKPPLTKEELIRIANTEGGKDMQDLAKELGREINHLYSVKTKVNNGQRKLPSEDPIPLRCVVFEAKEGIVHGDRFIKYFGKESTSAKYLLLKYESVSKILPIMLKYHKNYLIKALHNNSIPKYNIIPIAYLLDKDWVEMFTYWIFTEEVSELYYLFNTPKDFDWYKNRMASLTERLTYFYCYFWGVEVLEPYVKASIKITARFKDKLFQIFPHSIAIGRAPREILRC